MINLLTFGIPTPMALAVVALIGYLMGRRLRKRSGQLERGSARRELKRAKAVVRQLDAVARDVRRNLASHHTSVLRFKERINRLSKQEDGEPWQELCEEAELVLKPTMKLASQIAHAYDEIRQQTKLLMTFTEARTDALTGLSNRRAMEESLRTMFAMMSRYDTVFAVTVISVDQFSEMNEHHGRLYGDHLLQKIARLLDEMVRETDVATRSYGEQFAIVMPETNLAGACVLAERLRVCVQEQLSVALTIGVASALDGDNPRTLLARAETALECAKMEGGDRVFKHNGHQMEPIGLPLVEHEPDEDLLPRVRRLETPADEVEVDRV